MSSPSKAVLVPPRPNLGPEPMLAPWSFTAAIVATLIVLVLVMTTLLAMLAYLRRFARRDRLRAECAARHGLPRDFPESSRERWIIFSRAIRQALATRFGQAWGAKTTEEIAAEHALADVLGPERSAELIHLLQQADRAKFADSPVADPPVPLPYLSDLVMALTSTAGERSRIRGK